MTELYPKAETQRLKKRVLLFSALAWLIAAAALIACVACCMRVTTLHALRLQWTAVIVSTAAGWLVILLYSLVIAPLQALRLHADGLAKGQPETFAGILTVQPAAFQIPHSVKVRKVLLDGEAPLTLHVADCKAHLLPANGAYVRVHVVRRYITSWEVCHEND